jgi:general L-amino acid transport system substrate-binding protein
LLLTLKGSTRGFARILAISAGLGLAAGSYLSPAAAFSGDTIEQVRKRDYVLCGVAEGAPGFSTLDDKGVWWGLDVDFCRAIAAAVLGSKDKVKFRPLSPSDRFKALSAKEIDVLARGAPWTMSRDTELGIRFVGTLFHDGQGFLVRRNLAITSILELSGATICALEGASGEQVVTDYFRLRQMRYQPMVSKKWDELVQAYSAERCSLLSGDVSQLALERSRLSNPADHTILPELVSKEPRGPAVAQGDEQWFAVVRWVLMALIAGEELGLTSANIDEVKTSTVAEVQHFLGIDRHLGQGLGLSADWAYQLIKQVGNYGELYERNLGTKSVLKIDRGANDIWTRGGLMYAPPFR